MFNIVNKVDKNKLKRSCVESIQKNRFCIDYLERFLTRSRDVFNYTKKRDDGVEVEVLEWIIFNMKYNTKMIENTLKQNGGNPNAIESVEWE